MALNTNFNLIDGVLGELLGERDLTTSASPTTALMSGTTTTEALADIDAELASLSTGFMARRSTMPPAATLVARLQPTMPLEPNVLAQFVHDANEEDVASVLNEIDDSEVAFVDDDFIEEITIEEVSEEKKRGVFSRLFNGRDSE